MTVGYINVKKSSDSKEVVIELQGQFDYQLHREFRDAYKDTNSKTSFVIDMHKTENIDSSALGMMLLLREHAGGESAKIKIVGCRERIKKIMSITNFDQLFNIS